MTESNQIELPVEESLDHILPELRIFARPMALLIPDPENARKHDAANLKLVAESLVDFKQRSLLVVNRDTGYISKGNGTYMAARMLGWKTIAYIYVDDDRIQSLAYGLIDNESSDSSAFDHSQKGKHLRELKAADYPLSAFWNEEDLGPYMHEEFQRPAITDEVFDPGLKKGRAIKMISTAERLTVDRAIAFVRTKTKQAMTEGAILAEICGQFLASHINEVTTETTVEIEKRLEVASLSLDDDD